MKSLGIFVTTIVLAACAGGGGGALTSDGTLSGIGFNLLNGSGLVFSDESISGSGSLVFTVPRIDEDSNYSLNFSLEPGGTVELVTNSDSELNNGIGILFGRGADSLTVRLVSTADDFDISSGFPSLNATGPMSISVDVHAHGHLITFENGERVEEFAMNLRPKNLYWGLRIVDAEVTGANVAGPREEE